MRIKFTETEIQDALKMLMIKKLSLENQPTNLFFYFCDDKNDVLNIEYVEIDFK